TRTLATARWTAAAAFAICLWLTALSSVYYAYYFGVAVGLVLVLHVALRCPAAAGAYLRVLDCGAIVLLALVPVFLPYLDVRERFGLTRAEHETTFFSSWGDLLLAAFLRPIAYVQGRYLQGPEVAALCGVGTVLLAVLGVVRGAAADR